MQRRVPTEQGVSVGVDRAEPPSRTRGCVHTQNGRTCARQHTLAGFGEFIGRNGNGRLGADDPPTARYSGLPSGSVKYDFRRKGEWSN